MSNARNILEERLAKGEISEEEFESLSAKLSKESPVNVSFEKVDQAQLQDNVVSNTGSTIPGFIKFILLYLVVCAVFFFGFGPKGMHDGVYQGCQKHGGSPNYCQCVARTYSQQANFFLAPFQTFGIFIDRTKSDICRK